MVSTDSLGLAEGSADMWDTGRVISSQTNDIYYQGEELSSRTKYYWRVIVWNQDGQRSAASPIASWETGIFDLREWEGDWIGAGHEDLDSRPAPYFRKEFEARGPIKEARAYISGLGYYILRINGERVGTRLLDPAYTDYVETVKYT